MPSDWDFGTYYYDVSKEVTGLIDYKIGNGINGQVVPWLKWTDNTPPAAGDVKVSASISGVPEANMEAGSFGILLAAYYESTSAKRGNTRLPSERYDHNIDTRWEYNGYDWPYLAVGSGQNGHTYEIPFKKGSPSVQITGSADARLPTGRIKYDWYKQNGTHTFGVPVNNVRIKIPAGCSFGKVTMTVNWDIATAPR